MGAEGGSETGGDKSFEVESSPGESSIDVGGQVIESPQDSSGDTPSDAEAPAEV